MSLPNIYVPIGHGEEELSGRKPVIPPGCQLVVLAQCKLPVHWGDEQNAEQLHIKDFIATNPDRIGIFADPVHNRREINAAIGSVCAFYGPGDEYPNIFYTLNLSWTRPTISLRYSGVVPFTTYISDTAETGFTTKNIYNQVYTGGQKQMYLSPNPREIYRYSIFPRPQEFPTEHSSKAEMIEFLLHTKDIDMISPTRESLEGRTQKELYEYITDVELYSYDRVNNVKLSTLMAQMPGVYYHLVCRGDMITSSLVNLPRRRRASFIQRRLPGLTRKEIIDYILEAPGIKPLLYENARNILGPYDELPENIRAALIHSRQFLLPSEGTTQGSVTTLGRKKRARQPPAEGGRRTYKQRRSKRKTRRY